MQDRPTAAELLRDIAELLDDRILPLLGGHEHEQHQVRVAANLCRIIEREVRIGPELAAEEEDLLRSLLPEAGPEVTVVELNRELAVRIAATDDRAFLGRAHAALVTSIKGKLAVVKPGHDRFDLSAELPA